jgi:hypothetical protein
MYLRTTLTALALVLMSLPASAQSINASDPEGLIQALQNIGYKATMDTADDGDPLIRSMADGTNFRIWFYGCDDANSNCTGLNFSAGFDLEKGTTLEKMNAWNNNQLLGYATLDDENDPFLNHFVVTNGGISAEAFQSIIERWDRAIADFKAEINF